VFGLYVSVLYGQIESAWFRDNPSGALAEHANWLRRAGGWEPYSVTVSPACDTVSILALRQSTGSLSSEDVDALRAYLRETLSRGRLISFDVFGGVDPDATLLEARSRGYQAFPGPGSTCGECHHPSPGHFWNCTRRDEQSRPLPSP
jgi:hypothetical protein